MNTNSATSPFIKTAFIAVALISSSISSASHAGDLLGTLSMQGLESQLKLDYDIDAEFDRIMRLLDSCIYHDPATELLKKKIQERIAKHNKDLKAADAKVAQIDKEIADLERQQPQTLEIITKIDDKKSDKAAVIRDIEAINVRIKLDQEKLKKLDEKPKEAKCAEAKNN